MVSSCDVSDNFEVTAAGLGDFRHFGGVRRFEGTVVTVRVSGDNVLVRRALEAAEPGTVLVVDGGARRDCALLGDRLAAIGAERGVTGVVVNGCVRDSRELAGLPVAVLALGTHPRRSAKGGEGETEVPVTFGGVTWDPGAWVLGDEDGFVLAPTRPAI